MRKSLFAAALLGTLSLVPAAVFAADAPTVGSPAPNFTLSSQLDKPVSLSDFKGKFVVLYFYPKDATPGCTVEAHNFQRDEAKYTALNAAVVGVSLDTVDSHKQFCTKETLSFKLLADPDHKVVDEYGVPVKGMGSVKYASRQTFLIGPDGKVIKFWPNVDSNLKGHSDDVLAAITQASNK